MNEIHPLAKWLSEHGSQYGAQAELARAAGCSDSHLCLIIKGKRTPSVVLVGRLSQVTGISPLELRPDIANMMSEAAA